MTRPAIDYEHLKRVIPIAAVLARYHIELRSRGDDLVGRCPVHGGTNDRQFIVSVSKNLCTVFHRTATAAAPSSI